MSTHKADYLTQHQKWLVVFVLNHYVDFGSLAVDAQLDSTEQAQDECDEIIKQLEMPAISAPADADDEGMSSVVRAHLHMT